MSATLTRSSVKPLRVAAVSLVWAGACADEPLVGTTAATTEPGPTGPTSFDPVPTTGDVSGAPGASTTGDAPSGTGGEIEGTTAATTDAPGPFCGDGVVDPGEACDDGAGNGDQAFCTSVCVLNYCGDGKLLVGHELCDAGAGNSDDHGALCTTLCKPGAWCGDHIVQPAHETCDLGPDNGTDVGDAQGILCAANCRQEARRGFVTSATFTGDLGGVFAADARCRELAAAAGDPQAEHYYAFLSTGEQSVAERFAPLLGAPLPYVTPNGKKFADSFTDLLATGPVGPGISVTETGASLVDAYVLTDTAAPGGETYAAELDCDGWTSADPQLGARVGWTFPADPAEAAQWSAEGWWTSYLDWGCSSTFFHLYCLEL